MHHFLIKALNSSMVLQDVMMFVIPTHLSVFDMLNFEEFVDLMRFIQKI